MADFVVFFILKLSLFELQTISAELKPLGDGPEEMENGKRQSVKWQVEFHIIFNCLSSPFLSLFHILHTTPFLSFTSFTPLFLLYFSVSLFLSDKLPRDDGCIYVIGTHEHTHTHRDPDSTYTNTPTVHYSTVLRLCQIGLVEQYWVTQNNKHTH